MGDIGWTCEREQLHHRRVSRILKFLGQVLTICITFYWVIEHMLDWKAMGRCIYKMTQERGRKEKDQACEQNHGPVKWLTCPVSPRSEGRRVGPNGACGGSAPALSRPTSARWDPSVPHRTSGGRLGLQEKTQLGSGPT